MTDVPRVPDPGELERQLALWMSTVVLEPSTDWLDAAIAVARDRRQARSLPRLFRVPIGRRRSSTIMVARIAAAVLVIAAGVVLVEHGGRAPDPVQTPTPTTAIPSTPTTATSSTSRPAPSTLSPSTTSPLGAPESKGPFAAVEIFLDVSGQRPSVDVVARSVDGSVRTLGRLASDGLPEGVDFNGVGKISRSGWLALSLGKQGVGGWAFVDLGHPERPLRLVPGLFDGGAWGPTDLLALGQSGKESPVVIDPVTGNVDPVVGAQVPGGNPDYIWNADGSGLLSSTGGGFNAPAPDDQPRTWSLTPLDGSGDVTGVPALDPWRGTRYVVAGGRWLTNGACSSVIDQCVPGDATAGAENPVVVRDATGATTTWYDHDIADATLLDNTFSVDGTALWLLLYRPLVEGGELVLAAVDAAHDVRVVRTDPIAAARFGNMWFAPDDSVTAISLISSSDSVTTVIAASDGSGPPVALAGRFAGFISVANANAIATVVPPTPPTT